MKILNLKILYSLFFIINLSIYSQSDPIIAGLNSADILVRRNTLFTIMNKKLIEYLPELERRIFQQEEPVMITNYLEVLFKLNSTNIKQIIHQYILMADEFGNMIPPRDPLESKILATQFLFLLNDYSTSNLVFEIVNRDREKVGPDIINMLENIMINLPEHQETIKSELVYLSQNANSEYARADAVSILKDNFGSNYNSIICDRFLNDFKPEMRSLSLDYLIDNAYPDLNGILHLQLNIDEDPSVRLQIGKTLLIHFGKPNDLKFVIDHQSIETDVETKGLINYSINSFIPPRPTVTTAEMIDNLISYNNELFHYGWITDQRTYNQYAAILGKIQTAYRSHSQRDLCENLSALLSTVEKHHNTPLLTTEGYKFLYYHGKYIKENVEQEFGSCP